MVKRRQGKFPSGEPRITGRGQLDASNTDENRGSTPFTLNSIYSNWSSEITREPFDNELQWFNHHGNGLYWVFVAAPCFPVDTVRHAFVFPLEVLSVGVSRVTVAVPEPPFEWGRALTTGLVVVHVLGWEQHPIVWGQRITYSRHNIKCIY